MSPLALALLILTDAAALALVIRARAPWVLRAATIVVVLGVAFAIWSASSGDAGWPSRQPIPDKAAVLGCIVEEPVGAAGGAIYLWLIPPSSSSNPLASSHQQGEPRAYAEPYDIGLAAACQQAQKIAGNGGHPGIRTNAHARAGGPQGPHTHFRAYQLPPSRPPAKA